MLRGTLKEGGEDKQKGSLDVGVPFLMIIMQAAIRWSRRVW